MSVKGVLNKGVKKMVWRLLYMLSLLFFASSLYARNIQFSLYTMSDGLASDKVYQIDQDTCGRLWTTSDGGVSRFDGSVMKVFDLNSYPSLKRNDLYHVKCYEDGSTFLGGTQGVLVKYDNLRDCFVDYSPEDFKNTYFKTIEGFSKTRNGEPVIFTSGGIYMLKEGQERFSNDFPVYKTFKDIYVRSFYEDIHGRYWVSSFNRLYVSDKEGKIIREFDLFKDLSSMYSSKVIPISDSLLLLSCFSDVLCKIKIAEDGSISEPEFMQLPFSNLGDILLDEKGVYWYITDGYGLWCSSDPPEKGARFEKIYPTNESVGYMEKIYSIHQGIDEKIWIGTQSAGLWSFSPYSMEPMQLSSDFQFPKREVTSFIECEDGSVYVASDGGGLILISKDLVPIRYYAEQDGLKSCNVLSMNKGSEGKFWIATWGGGVLTFDTHKKTFDREQFEGLNSNLSCFVDVRELSNGEVWVCSGGDGLYMRDVGKKWQRYILQFSEREFDMWPSMVREGKNGVRWVATSRSVWRLDGDKREALLPDFSQVLDNNPMNVNDMVVDEDGGLFIATNKSIVHFSEDGTVLDTLVFLPKGRYASLCFDESGLLRACGDVGLLTIDYANKKFYANTLRSKVLNNFHNHSATQLADGRLLWGTKSGFILQNKIPQNRLKHSHVRFSDIQIGRRTCAESTEYLEVALDGKVVGIKVPHDMSEINMNVEWVDFTGEDVDFSYRLNGLSDQWTKLSSDRTIRFSYIPYGKYELELSVERNGMQEALIALPIIVQTPWWLTWWAISLFIFSLLLIVFLIFYFRFKGMKERQIELKRMVDERTKELYEKNAQIEVQNEQLNAALTDKDRVLSVIAHDLKNPMFAIVGALEGWLRKEPDMKTEEKRSVVADVLKSSEVLQNEMIRLLEWARAKKEQIDYKPTNVDLSSLLSNVVSLLSSVVLKKNIEMNVNCDVHHCLWGDSRMLGTIFRNFVNNALKFTHEGGKVSVEAREEEQYIVVLIKDNGIGMSQEQLLKLKKDGYCNTTSGTQNEKGTGLGFRICLDYIEKNNGLFDIESEPNVGTTIVLKLPKSSKTVEEVRTYLNVGENTSVEWTIDKDVLEGNVAVVVDDDQLICKNIAEMLRPYMTVYLASNGEEALSIVSQNEVDLILSDMEMPVMNGLELSRRLSNDERTSSIPLLFLSAKNEQSDRLLGLLSGAIDYISKPFSAGELLMKVNNVLRLRQKQQNRLLQQYYEDRKVEDVQNLKVSQPEETVNEAVKEEKLNPFVDNLMKFIEDNYKNSELSIEDIASAMFVSQSTLSRRSKSLLGKSPVELISEFRLNKAMQILKNQEEELNVSEVAYSVGFSDPAYFSRKFKEFFGVLPSAVKQ